MGGLKGSTGRPDSPSRLARSNESCIGLVTLASGRSVAAFPTPGVGAPKDINGAKGVDMVEVEVDENGNGVCCNGATDSRRVKLAEAGLKVEAA